MFHTELEATSHCNTRCLHCPHEAISRPAGRMDWVTYTTVIDKIRRYTQGAKFSVSFSGMGEPLLNPLLFRFIKHISDDAVTSFASNGAALTPQNISRLIEAGLDTVYLSFNGDEPGVYSKMMGGLSYDRAMDNLRQAVALSKGTRLKIRANVSITKANQDRVTRIKTLLESEAVGPVTFSLGHSRGGNLTDRNVCDTPAMDLTQLPCDVMKNTLFVDWQGKAHICDHDLHGDYGLGDLMTEPLETVLTRRQSLLEDSSALKICRECNDIMRIGGTLPLASGGGGNFRDWVYYLHQDLEDPLSEASEPLKWIFQIYQKENRTDRFANRLLAIEKATQAELQLTRRELADRIAKSNSIQFQFDERGRELDRVQRLLDERDRQFQALHQDYVAMRRHLVWRIVRMVRNDFKRVVDWSRLRSQD